MQIEYAQWKTTIKRVPEWARKSTEARLRMTTEHNCPADHLRHTGITLDSKLQPVQPTLG